MEEHKPQIDKVLAQLRVGQRIRFQESLKLIKQRQPLPFANPYYWAGFTAIAIGGYSVPSDKFFGQPDLPNQ
ncbi:hypothetical protein [Nostoc sp. DSM 114161]|uniref:hypothetical protein n=1 Tax=Nostoc sp. DSM 114161 TaxID=3440143 RepID=UPI0040467E92